MTLPVYLPHPKCDFNLTLRMMKRAEAAKCLISGLMDFRNASNGVTLAHCLATYGQVLALETVIENDPNIVNLVDDSGSGSKDSRPDRFGFEPFSPCTQRYIFEPSVVDLYFCKIVPTCRRSLNPECRIYPSSLRCQIRPT